VQKKTDQETLHESVLKYDWTKGRQEVWILKEELDKVAVCHGFYSTYTVSTLPWKLLMGFWDFKIGGQVIHTVKYAADLVLLAKEGTVLRGTIDRLTEILQC
jgi:hypothetical protein